MSANLSSPVSPHEYIAALHHTESGVRTKTLETLKDADDATIHYAEVLPVLRETALQDEDGGVRMRAVEALGQIGARTSQCDENLFALIAAFRDRDAGVRAHAARALGQIGAPAAAYPELLPALLAAMQDSDNVVSTEAAHALGRLMSQGVRIFRRWWGKSEEKRVADLAGLQG
jgi:hypothetical protein